MVCVCQRKSRDYLANRFRNPRARSRFSGGSAGSVLSRACWKQAAASAVAAQVVEDQAAVVVEPGVVGAVLQRAVEVPQGFVQPSQACQDQGAAVVRIGQAGLAPPPVSGPRRWRGPGRPRPSRIRPVRRTPGRARRARGNRLSFSLDQPGVSRRSLRPIVPNTSAPRRGSRRPAGTPRPVSIASVARPMASSNSSWRP